MTENTVSTIQDLVGRIFNDRQLFLLELEKEVDKINIDDDGKIIVPNYDPNLEERATAWREKKGVIDVKDIFGALVIAYNSHIETPEGCPNMRAETEAGRRSNGQYYPTIRTCYIDFHHYWDCFDEKWKPSYSSGDLRHELRHHLVTTEDDKYSEETGKNARRHIDFEGVSVHDSEELRQLAYLDELHSQYFDAIEADIIGWDYFMKIDSKTYFGTKEEDVEGPLKDIASSTPEGKKAAEELFYHIQGMILLRKMTQQEQYNFSEDIELATRAAGVALATERNIQDAKQKFELIWEHAMNNPEIKQGFSKFLETYKPHYPDWNAPVITPELKETLGLTEV
ncbi:hypothetical protein KY343_04935 [Candidatus Woesearchaeota archaeon]|nr:hypothetical protein [Candidatus Woesearchaeota archaeon]